MLDGCERAAKPGSPVLQELKKTKWDVAVVHFVDCCTFGMTEVGPITQTILVGRPS